MIRTNAERLVEGRTLVLVIAALVAASLLFAKPAHAKTFTVNNTFDVGNGICNASGCTLNEAIGSANANPGADTIGFDIPGDGIRTIALTTSPLPEITGPVTMDGYTQPGSRPNTRATGALDAVVLIELSGTGSGLDINASNVVVRGLVINRASGNGIEIDSGTGSRIEGNFIGTDPSGTLDRGNFSAGVSVDAGGQHTVGGATPAARNLISGNNSVGIEISDNSKVNKVQGNLVGTQKDGTSPLGNSGEGIYVNSSNNVIGGAEPAAANTIAFNVGNGMGVESSTDTIATGNRILSNSVFSNGGLGIDLETRIDDATGRTANDPRDPDAGPNTLQNFPVITAAMVSEEGTTRIEGMLDSTPSTRKKKRTFIIQFFSNPSASEEGKSFLGQKKVTTNRRGQASFAFVAAAPVRAGENIVTATASGRGGTSEFSDPKGLARP